MITAVSAIPLPASADPIAGAAIRAGVGAAAGHGISGRDGALVGGTLGAVAGYQIGKHRRYNRHRHVRHSQRPVHHYHRSGARLQRTQKLLFAASGQLRFTAGRSPSSPLRSLPLRSIRATGSRPPAALIVDERRDLRRRHTFHFNLTVKGLT